MQDSLVAGLNHGSFHNRSNYHISIGSHIKRKSDLNQGQEGITDFHCVPSIIVRHFSLSLSFRENRRKLFFGMVLDSEVPSFRGKMEPSV